MGLPEVPGLLGPLDSRASQECPELQVLAELWVPGELLVNRVDLEQLEHLVWLESKEDQAQLE